MNCSNTKIESLISITQIYFAYKLFSLVNPFLAIGLIVSLYIGYFFFLKYNGYTPLKAGDKMLLGDHFNSRQLLICALEIENMNSENISSLIKERAIDKVKKLRSVMEYKYFNFYWKELNLSREEIYDRTIKKINAMTRDELHSYIQSTLSTNVDLFNSPIKFQIIPLKNETNGILLIITDHAFTDGLGILNLIVCLSDNFSQDIFPRIMKSRDYSLFRHFIDFCLFLIFGIFIIIYLLINTKSKHRFSKNPRSNQVSLENFIDYDLKAMKDLSKKLKISINELALSTLLSAVKMYTKETAKEITLMIPFGQTPIPKHTSEIHLANYVSGLVSSMTLIEHPLKNRKTFINDYKKLLQQALLIKITDWGIFFLSYILPFNIFKAIEFSVVLKIDICCSNVPGPNEVLIYNGCKVKKINPIASSGYLSLFFPIFSYNEKITIYGVHDKNLNIDCKQILSNFDLVYKSLLEESKIK
jgi:hypothetical protein